MKTKLTMIVLVMALGGWMAVGDGPQDRRHPRPRSLEQRVADLERLVEAQSYQIAEQQAQIDRFAPILNEMELVTWADGAKTIRMRSADLWVDGGSYSQFNSVVLTDDLYLFGDIINY